MRTYLFVFAACATVVIAADRPDVTGSWQLDAAKSEINDAKLKSEILDIHQTEGSVQISEAITEGNGKQRKSDISCTTTGETCKVKSSGGEQVTFWYNAGALVMTEMRHGNDWVVKRRLMPSADGKTLDVEVTHLAPRGQKDEKMIFNKQ